MLTRFHGSGTAHPEGSVVHADDPTITFDVELHFDWSKTLTKSQPARRRPLALDNAVDPTAAGLHLEEHHVPTGGDRIA